MKIIKQPNNIKFGLGAAKDFSCPEKSLVITSKRGQFEGMVKLYKSRKTKMLS